MVHHYAGTNRENHLEQQILTTEHPKHDAERTVLFYCAFALNCKGAFLCPPWPQEAGAGIFYTKICPARRKTVQPVGATPQKA